MYKVREGGITPDLLPKIKLYGNKVGLIMEIDMGKHEI